MIVRLDKKDLRLLSVLDKEPTLSVSLLAKRIGTSRQVAEYRIQKLIAQKTIYAFYTLIDVGRLGYSSFRVHIRLKNVSENEYKTFAQDLFTNYPTFWVAYVSGSFDLITDIFAKNPNEFQKIFSQILIQYKHIISSYDILVILDLTLYEYGYFLLDKKLCSTISLHQNSATEKIDVYDKQILNTIKHNFRLPYDTVAKEVRMSRNGIKNRINMLEKKKIIVGYKIVVDFAHFGLQSFKILVRYNQSKIEQEKELLAYLKTTTGILNTLKLLGTWNLDIEIQKKNVKELQKFIMNLRNKFDIIGNYEIIQIIEDYGIDFFPKKIESS